MDWTADGIAKLITALGSAIGGAVAWTVSRRDRKVKTTETTAIKTVESWEAALERKNEQIAALTADYDRAREIIDHQDRRIDRKDQRIAHLETLLDRRKGAGW